MEDLLHREVGEKDGWAVADLVALASFDAESAISTVEKLLKMAWIDPGQLRTNLIADDEIARLVVVEVKEVLVRQPKAAAPLGNLPRQCRFSRHRIADDEQMELTMMARPLDVQIDPLQDSSRVGVSRSRHRMNSHLRPGLLQLIRSGHLRPLMVDLHLVQM